MAKDGQPTKTLAVFDRDWPIRAFLFPCVVAVEWLLSVWKAERSIWRLCIARLGLLQWYISSGGIYACETDRLPNSIR